MATHKSKGKVTQQAHVNIPQGTFEEEHGRDGFYGDVSHLYHANPPVNWTRIEGPLKPRAYNCNKLPPVQQLGETPERVTVLHNQDVAVQVWRHKTPFDYFFRNADGDELFFIHRGSGEVQTDYGLMPYTKGDYIVMPKGTTYRFIPTVGEENFFLLFESKAALKQPERGLLGQHALYDETVIHTPDPHDFNATSEPKKEWEVRVKRQNKITHFYYPFHPMDVVGWKGTLYPWKLNVKDICPVMSHRAHLPPSVHSTFVTEQFVVVTFLPRPLESAEGAVRVPFYHRNIDYDEVLFYHEGDFFSRDNIDAGMITYHPQGFHHGPHAAAFKASWEKLETDEIAVMLDTVNPLHYTSEAEEAEWKEYWKSWQVSEDKAGALH